MAQKNRELRKESNSVRRETEVMVHHGPLPDPATFQQYNKVIPDAAERIMNIYESEVSHRHNLESEQIELHKKKLELERLQLSIEKNYADSEARNSLLGILSAFLLSVLVIGGGMYMIVATEHSIAGTLFSGVGLASLIGMFIRGTKIKHEDKKKSPQ